MRIMTLFSIGLCAAFVGCGTSEDEGQDGPSVAPPADCCGPQGSDAGAEPPPGTSTVGGQAFGEWCGTIKMQGSITVPEGETLSICAGSVVQNATEDLGTALVVRGTLRVEGTPQAPVRLGAGVPWRGLRVAGTLSADEMLIDSAAVGLETGAGATVDVRSSRIADCDTTLRAESDVNIERTLLLDGPVSVGAGTLHLTDTVVDLGHPGVSPDCISFGGGGAHLDHTLITGCHCPLHINVAELGLTVEASVLEGAVAVMIAHARATFSGNHIIGSSTDVLDIGGGISADLAGNYYGENGLQLDSGAREQFTGADQPAAGPIAEVGPRAR